VPIQDDLLSPRKKRGPSVLPFLLVGALALGGAAFAVGRLTAGPPAPPGSLSPGGQGGSEHGAGGSGGAAPVAAAPPAPAPIPPGQVLPGTDGLRRVRVKIAGSLAASLATAVGPEVAEPLTQVTTRLLVWSLNVARQTQPGDELEVLYELPEGKEPLLHALRYKSVELGKELRAYRFQPPGAPFARYYDETGAEIELRLKDSPIDNYEQVTSLLKDGRRHKGVDFKTPAGTPVKMPWDGVITRKNWNWRGNGNCLEITDARGRKTIFLHLDELPKDVRTGQRVEKGQVVAHSGNTGHSFAPHLHYQLMQGERVIDPYDVHETFRASLDATAKPAYQAAIAKVDAILATDPTAPWIPPAAPVAAAAAPVAGTPGTAAPQ
jgi:murein DD-endopeptidase MepM/ murein hydrolase activator NlpD